MTELLDAAYPFVKSGEFFGIRISTRPDAVDDEILDILESRGVTSIELGAQSMDDEVLCLNSRGHTAADVEKASGLIKSRGFSLGLQMMTSLYGSSDERDRETAEKLAALSPDTVRIYPTVVMKGTRLGELYDKGLYRPKNAEQSVPLCAELMQFFESQGINVIRVGLHDSPTLRESMTGGAFHPAFRELCESHIMLEKAAELVKSRGLAGDVVFYVNPSSVSRFTGQKRKNTAALKEMGVNAAVKTDPALDKLEVRAEQK